MKKKIIAGLAVILALASCTEELSPEANESGDIYAKIEQDNPTKTVLDPANNVCWCEGDEVVAFMKTSLGLKYRLKDAYIGKSYGYFSKVSSTASEELGAGMEWAHNVVYYPYNEQIECTMQESGYLLDIDLPLRSARNARSVYRKRTG